MRRIETPEPRHKKAVGSELLVGEWFKRHGFSIEHTTGKGPDLVCCMDGFTINVEVKAASSCDRSRLYWRVGKVGKFRKEDHLVAIVTDDGRIFMDDMKEHLRRCSNVGQRQVTNLVNKEY